MKARPPAGTSWLLCLCILLLTGLPAQAQTYSLTSTPGSDLLTLTFPRKTPPPLAVRTGAKRVELLFPDGVRLKGLPGSLASGRTIASLDVADNVLVIETQTEAFGFVTSPKGDRSFLVQVFPDPAGARWQPLSGGEEAGRTATTGGQTAGTGGQTTGIVGQTATPATGTDTPPTPARQAAAPSAGQGANGSRQAATPGQTPAASAAQTPGGTGTAASGQSDAARAGGAITVSLDPAGQAPSRGTPAQSAAPPPLPEAQGQAAPPQAQGAPAPPQAQGAQPPPPAQSQARQQEQSQAGRPASQEPSSQVRGSLLAPPPASVAQPGAQSSPPPGGGQAVTGQLTPPATPSPPAASQAVTGQFSPPAPPASPSSDAAGAVTGQLASPTPTATPPAGTQAVTGQITPPAPSTPPPPAGGQAVTGLLTPPAPSTPATPTGGQAVTGQITQPEPQPSAPQAQGAPPAAPGQAAQQTGQPPQAPQQTGQPGAAPAAPGQPVAGEPVDSIEDKTLLISGEQAFAAESYDKALGVADALLERAQQNKISKKLWEDALHLRAKALFEKNRKNLAEAFIQTNEALQTALNFNTTSPQLPRLLIRLGYLNLRQGNIPEARAYFNLLRNRYALDEDVPLIDVYWGQHFLDQAKQRDAKLNYERAAQSFREVLQKSPESRYARDAALGLTEALLELGQNAEAAKIVDYVDKRWPRYYVEQPSLRRLSGDIAYKLGDFQKAKDEYLWFYNIAPTDKANDLVLARLGDVSARLGKREAAREFYDMAIRLHPGSEGALMSMMRLAEQGINDAPTVQEMFKSFADPTDIRPDRIYEIIISEYAKSPLAPLAMLKLAMWRLYKGELPETLELVGRFLKSYPGNDLEKSAVEVGAQAFGKMLSPLLEEMNYARILELWRTYPFLAGQAQTLSDRERLGVALALYYQGAPREALDMTAPYLDKGPTPEAQKALALMLTIYRENQDWQGVLEALKKTSSWKLADGPRRALEFAQAMALEHTGEFARSRLLWARLAQDTQLDPGKRAYALYYQGRTAYDRKDYDKALVWAGEARMLFKEAAKDDGKARDALHLMVDASQAAGRLREALALSAEYETEAPAQSAEWAANRMRMAELHRRLGDTDSWRKILEKMRDEQAGTLFGRLAASELAARGIEEKAGRLTGPN